MIVNTRQLFELAGAEDARKTSPFCWRIRFALRHKRLQFDSLPWRRVEKERLASTGQGKVPVLIDGYKTLHDSWKIAEYLDSHYPDLPLLFFGDTGKDNVRLTGQTIRFTVNWVDHSLIRALRNIISHGSVEVSADKDKEFYTNKLHTVHGVDLPTVGGSERHLSHLNDVLEPMRLTLQAQHYLGGSSPSYADFAVAGAFAWARSVSPIKLLEASDPLYIWRARVFEQFHQDLTETTGYPY
ncbi:hypothetical protein WJX77_010466 [Trebouxia sp. C0004]